MFYSFSCQCWFILVLLPGSGVQNTFLVEKHASYKYTASLYGMGEQFGMG